MKNLFIRLSLVMALLATGLMSYAQTTVKGTVKDAAGNGVVGASVMVQGTQNGAIVNMDGSFSLSGVKTGDVLEVSCIGYAPQTITWTGGPVNVMVWGA